MPLNDEDIKKNNKATKNRRKLFGNGDSKNKISKNQSELKNNLNIENRQINSALFGGYENTVDQINDGENDPTAALQQKLDSISTKFKSSIGSNPMEFLNKIELDKNSGNKEVFKKSDNSRIKKLQSILKNSNGEFFLEEKDRFFRYEDYRLIDAYIPEVSKCLDLFRDCIMSPDDITKRSLTYFYDDECIDESKINPEFKFISGNLETLDKTYKLTKTIRNDIREACELGDLFYLIMPYSKGFSRILKEDDMFVTNDANYDSDAYGEKITESMLSLDDDEYFNALFEDVVYLSNHSDKGKEYNKIVERSKKEIIDSLNNNVKFFKDPCDLLSDAKKEENHGRSSEINVNINGSIFKKLAPENIVVLEIDKQILGYIYIEKNNINLAQNRASQRNANPNSLRSGNTGSTINTTDSLGYGSNDVFNSRYDYLNRDQSQIKSKYTLISQIFVKGISKKINKEFLKRNQEFKDLIYSLVHEEYITKKEVKMTFIEPQYIFHFKLGSNEIYGISKISKSLFFSKIYLSVLLTNLMQKIIRGRD